MCCHTEMPSRRHRTRHPTPSKYTDTGPTCRCAIHCNTYASKQLLYHDTGWGRLSTRKENQRLCLFSKIVNELSPPHLCKLLDTYLINNQRYEFRCQNIPIPRARTETYICSFFQVQFALAIIYTHLLRMLTQSTNLKGN